MSKAVTLFNNAFAAKILWMRTAINALTMVADRSPDGITCMSTSGLQIGHQALIGSVTDNYVRSGSQDC